METAAWLQIVAVPISLAAAIFAWAQAGSARRSAEAAEAQAEAAREALAVSRRQLELLEQDRASAVLPKVRLTADPMRHGGMVVGSFLKLINAGTDLIHIESVIMAGQEVPYLQYAPNMTTVKALTSIGPGATTLLLLSIAEGITYSGPHMSTRFDDFRTFQVSFRNEANGRKYKLTANVKAPKTGVMIVETTDLRETFQVG